MGQTAEELRLEAAEKRADLSRDLESLGDRVSPSRIAERRKAMVGQRVTQVKDRLMGAGESARTSTMHKMHDTSSSMSEGMHTMSTRTQDMAHGSPLAMGLVAFGAGVVIASMMPATEAERSLMSNAEPALSKVAGEAMSASREVMEEVKPAMADAASTVKERAQAAVGAVKDA